MKKNKLILALGAMLFASMLGVTAQADTPLYRLYNKGLKVHLYTKDSNEYAVLATRGWSQEGVAFRSFGETPVYRLYNRGLKKHLYTKDSNEYAVLSTRGWSQEGVAFMALSNKKVEAEKPVPELEQPYAPAPPVVEKVFGMTVEYKSTDGSIIPFTPFGESTIDKSQGSLLVSDEFPFNLYREPNYKIKSVELWTAKIASNNKIEKANKLPYSIPDTTRITYEQFKPLLSLTGVQDFFVEIVWEKN